MRSSLIDEKETLAMINPSEIEAQQIFREIPFGRQPFYQSFRDAGIAGAVGQRNVQWIVEADDGMPVFCLWRSYLRVSDRGLIADLDVRTWGKNGHLSGKAEKVFKGVSTSVGKLIRVVVVEDGKSGSKTARGTSFDPMLWQVSEGPKDLQMTRTNIAAFAKGSESEFTERMLRIYEDAKSQLGYVANYLRRKIVDDGGLAAARHWLRADKDPTEGFARLVRQNRMDISVEAVVLNPRWSHFFAEGELDVARSRLDEFGYFEGDRDLLATVADPRPDEVDPSIEYPEGMKKTVQVNAYERDPEARQKCIDHYGTVCYVCSFDFRKVYGKLGQGFIHVHHLNQVALMGTGAKTNPIRDLRPVCPNCHAMLHRKRPAVLIGELKLILQASSKRRSS